MRLPNLTCAIAVAALMTGIAASSARAQDICGRLWVERNAIYKAKGYCFKTQRAISYFGNAGCMYDYEEEVPLSRGERQRIGRIRAEERALGCR